MYLKNLKICQNLLISYIYVQYKIEKIKLVINPELHENTTCLGYLIFTYFTFIFLSLYAIIIDSILMLLNIFMCLIYVYNN